MLSSLLQACKSSVTLDFGSQLTFSLSIVTLATMMLLPVVLETEYINGTWVHWVFLGILTTGRRVVALHGSHMRSRVSETSPWHGAWEFRTNSFNGRGFFTVCVNYLGNESFLRTHVFHVRDFTVVLLSRFPALRNEDENGYGIWPNGAVLYVGAGRRGLLDINNIEERSEDSDFDDENYGDYSLL